MWVEGYTKVNWMDKDDEWRRYMMVGKGIRGGFVANGSDAGDAAGVKIRGIKG